MYIVHVHVHVPRRLCGENVCTHVNHSHYMSEMKQVTCGLLVSVVTRDGVSSSLEVLRPNNPLDSGGRGGGGGKRGREEREGGREGEGEGGGEAARKREVGKKGERKKQEGEKERERERSK